MRKVLAVLATVTTVGATMISAPAQARHIGPGLAFGLAAGALAAGAAAAYGPYYYGPGYYPGYYYDGGYYDEGGCYLVRQRVHTRHGWRVRRVEVCR